MISFSISLLALVLGYLIYGRFIARMFGPDDRPTPAISRADGVDYVSMPTWKVYMIQFLNIAGTGPIFGAIMGAMFGPSSFLWIVFGCIFGGAVHDYLSGMLSVRHDGESLPETVGRYLGLNAKKLMLVFSVILLILVGTVFVFSPAMLLADLTPKALDLMFWVIVVFVYYVLATMLPIDKIIGKIYPLFAFALLFMAVGLMVMLYVHHPDIPEIWDGLQNRNPDQSQPIFPCLFITIACGAISGFHGTQSPLMARCLKNEKHGYPVFYGAMITEGVVALVWAAVSSYLFFDGGVANSANLHLQAPQVVEKICTSWLGWLGGILAILGVVAAPITSGDTAFRSARLIIADFIHLGQKKIINRLYISVPLFLAAIGLLYFNATDKQGFNTIWNYFGWANQALATFTLWAVTVYMVRARKPYWLTLLPAFFMTTVCTTFLCISKTAFGLSENVSYIIGLVCLLVSIVWFFVWLRGFNQKHPGEILD
jgi:carbon starvation protein CstA